MALKREAFSVDLGHDLLVMVDQRAKQEGVTRSEYIREAIILEMVFSGDREALGFVAKKIGKRMKAAVLDRFGGADLAELSQVLTR